MDKKQLEQLYITEDLSMQKVAERLGMAKNNVRYWLIKYGITIKKWGRVKKFEITDQELEDLYLLKKLSAPKIAKRKKCSNSTIYSLLKRFSIPRRHIKF